MPSIIISTSRRTLFPGKVGKEFSKSEPKLTNLYGRFPGGPQTVGGGKARKLTAAPVPVSADANLAALPSSASALPEPPNSSSPRNGCTLD